MTELQSLGRPPRSLIQRAAEHLQTYPPEKLAPLRYVWELWALPHQVAPDWEFDTWLQIGGRGCGKNRAAAEWIRQKVYEGVMRFAFVGANAAKIREEMVLGETGILSVFPHHQKPRHIHSQSRVQFHTGAEALLITANKPQNLQGKNIEATWCDEISQYGSRLEEVWNQVCLATRVGKPQKVVTTNAWPVEPFLQRLVNEAKERDIAVTESSSFDNFENLPLQYQKQIRELSKTAYGRAMIFPKFWEPEGALWKKTWFRNLPSAPNGTGSRTVIGVDPAGTTKRQSDETGIVVVRRVGNQGFVLDDLTGKYSAAVWPKIVCDAYKSYGANLVVLETNRGLDSLAQLLRHENPTIRIEEIHTAEGKTDRALPVSALYELGASEGHPGIIFHCGGKLKKLEEQLIAYDPKAVSELRARSKASSPDRIDALVYAVLALRFHIGLATGPTFQPMPPSPRRTL